jgi:hypothetical protein
MSRISINNKFFKQWFTFKYFKREKVISQFQKQQNTLKSYQKYYNQQIPNKILKSRLFFYQVQKSKIYENHYSLKNFQNYENINDQKVNQNLLKMITES